MSLGAISSLGLMCRGRSLQIVWIALDLELGICREAWQYDCDARFNGSVLF